MAKQAVVPTHPDFVRHQKRPEWGVGRVLDVYSGLMRVRFADGETREFREDVLVAVQETDAPDALRALPGYTPPPPPKSAHRRVRKA